MILTVSIRIGRAGLAVLALGLAIAGGAFLAALS
jgi:hypothetical protein